MRTEPLARMEDRLGRQLALWAGLNIAAGAALQVVPERAWRAFGWQCLGWGGVNAALAAVGLWRASRPRQATTAECATGLRRLLLVNAVLDVLYLAGGLWLLRSGRRRQSAVRSGSGAGIAVQGLFLLAFDLLHASRVPGSRA